MKPIWVDAAKGTVAEMEQASSFLAHTAKNLFDPKVLSYPATKVLKAQNGEKNLLYMPVQQCQVWESLGVNPEASEIEIAASLRALAQVLRFIALADGQGEIYFLCSEPTTQAFAQKYFDKVDIPLYRMRIR